MKSHTKGRAYILANHCYPGSPRPDDERHYADVDTTNLTHLFAELGFEPEIHRNLSAQVL